MPALKKASLSDQLYQQLRTRIINLTYPLGSKLNVNELQEVFQVSSTPIREAVNRLQVEGLVVYERNVGARVLTLDAKDVGEIQDLAMTLHAAAIRFAMQRRDHGLLADEAAKHLKVYDGARTIDSRVKGVHDMIGVFYWRCGNSRLDNNMKVIQGEQLILRYLYHRHRGLNSKNTAHFQRMLEAVRAGEPERVIAILQENYDHATPVIVEALARTGAN